MPAASRPGMRSLSPLGSLGLLGLLGRDHEPSRIRVRWVRPMTKLGKSNAQNSNIESCQKTTQYPTCYCFQVVVAHDFRVPGLQTSAGDRRLGVGLPLINSKHRRSCKDPTSTRWTLNSEPCLRPKRPSVLGPYGIILYMKS